MDANINSNVCNDNIREHHMYSILNTTTCHLRRYSTPTIEGTVRSTENITGTSEIVKLGFLF